MEPFELKCDECGERIGHVSPRPRRIGQIFCQKHHDDVTALITGFDFTNCGAISVRGYRRVTLVDNIRGLVRYEDSKIF